LFANPASQEKQAAHEGTILFGYKEMDKLIGGFLDLADENTVIVFATGISQQACLVYEDQGGKVMYRPRDIAQLMTFAGVTEPHTAAPLMAEVFNVHLTNENDARCVEAKFNQLRVGDRPAMFVHRDGNVLKAKCHLHDRVPQDARIGVTSQNSSVPFFDLFFELEDAKSGMHHPDGILWIRLPRVAGKKHTEKVRLSSVAPTLLSLLSLEAPRHMGAPIRMIAEAAGRPSSSLVGAAST